MNKIGKKILNIQITDQAPSVTIKFGGKQKPGAENKEPSKDDTCIHKLKYILSILTIEPMMIFQGIASNITFVPQDQMVLYKICRGRS